MLEVKLIPVTPIEQNCRIIFDSKSREAVVVDPGGDSAKILAAIAEHNLQVKEIWLTHSHFDHCGGVREVQKVTAAKLYSHPNEKDFRENVEARAESFGLSGDLYNCPEPDVYLTGGETLKCGEFEFEVFFTPGHSPGHFVFYQRANGILLGGDTVFMNSIGRTDLPRGNYELLIASIRSKILTLPEDTKILSGHGPDTTVGREKSRNPFLVD